MRETQAGGTGRMRIAAVALAVLCAPALLGAQELTLVGTTTANGRQMQTTQYISPTATRMAMGDGSEIIIRSDLKKMYHLQLAQKTYTEMTFDEMQKMAAAAGANVTAAMDKLPPNAPPELKKMMAGMMDNKVAVTPAGPGEAIAGYATEKYHVVMGSIMEGDLWAAPALPPPAMLYDAMKAATPANPMIDMKQLFEEYKKIKGMPLKSVNVMKLMGQSMTSTTLITSVSKNPIPAGTFDVPAGFKLVAAK